MARIYLLPRQSVVQNGVDYGGPAHLEWRFNPGGIAAPRRDLYFFGISGHMLVEAETTPEQHAALVAYDDVLPVPENLDAVLTATQRTALANYLDRFNIPRAWLADGLTSRQVLHRLRAIFQFVQALTGAVGRLTALGITFDTRWRNLPANVQTALRAVAVRFDIDTSSVTANTTLGAILRLVAEQWLGTIAKPAGDTPLDPDFLAGATTETFTAANGTQVSALTGWAKNTSADFDVQSNRAQPDGAGELCNYQTGTYANNQYAQATVASAAGVAYAGVAVRCSTSAETYYGFYGASGAGTYLFYVSAGSWNQLGGTGTRFQTGDVIYLEADGTTITPKINGSTTNTPGAQTDSHIASGKAGITGYGDGAEQLDDWEGGDLGGGSTPASVNAVTAAATSAANVPAVAAKATVSGTTATATATALVPGVTGKAVVVSVVAEAVAEAPTPAVAGKGAVAGVSAEATADAPSPSASGKATVSGAVATSTATAEAPTASGKAVVTATVAEATAEMPAPAVSGGAMVAGITAQASAAMDAPTVTATASVAGAAAEATAEALAPAVTGSGNVTVLAVTATATATAEAPTIQASVTLNGVTATATATMPVPGVTVLYRATVTVSDAAVYVAAVADAAVYGAAASDAAVYGATISDAAVYGVAATDAAVYAVAVSDS